MGHESNHLLASEHGDRTINFPSLRSHWFPRSPTFRAGSAHRRIRVDGWMDGWLCSWGVTSSHPNGKKSRKPQDCRLSLSRWVSVDKKEDDNWPQEFCCLDCGFPFQAIKSSSLGKLRVVVVCGDWIINDHELLVFDRGSKSNCQLGKGQDIEPDESSLVLLIWRLLVHWKWRGSQLKWLVTWWVDLTKPNKGVIP